MFRIQFLPLLALMLLVSSACTAQKSAKTPPMIEKIITAYVSGGDHNNTSEYSAYQSDDFRVAFCNTAENTLSMLDKTTFNTLIDNKTFGGDTRKLVIESVAMHGDLIATVKVRMEGKKGSFYNLLSFAQMNGEWKLVQDLVYMVPK